MKKKIANIPFGPFISVLAGATVVGKPNYAAVGAYGVVSQNPVLYISLKNSHHTTAGVKANGFFSVNIPSSALICETDYCGTVSGHQADKSGVFESFYDQAGDAPMIRECPLKYLCKVIQTVPVFDFTMFFGEIVAAYTDEDCLENGRPDALKIRPVVMMDAGYFDLNQRIGTAFKSGQGYRAK